MGYFSGSGLLPARLATNSSARWVADPANEAMRSARARRSATPTLAEANAGRTGSYAARRNEGVRRRTQRGSGAGPRESLPSPDRPIDDRCHVLYARSAMTDAVDDRLDTPLQRALGQLRRTEVRIGWLLGSTN